MSKRITLGKVAAAIALSASIGGIATGTAAARPLSAAQCVQIENSMWGAYVAMSDAQRAGNKSEYRYWGKVYDQLQQTHSRSC